MTLKQQLKKFLKRNSRNEHSFTLVELVIVLGIVAVLALVVIVVLNPSEFLKESRDSTRIADLNTINKAIGYYQADGGSSFGTSNTVYVSIPDSSSTCANLGLPALPAGWSYSCSNSDNYRKVDSNGWIPIDLTNISFNSPLDVLPVDPVNTTSTGNYYTYTPGGSWELNAILESSRYRNNVSITKQNLPGVIGLGTDLSLSPITNTNGLVGYWKFDEGSGTTAADSSGNGNDGTLTNGPSWTSGKVASALSFDGVDDYVNCGNGESLNITNAITIEAWIYPSTQSGGIAYRSIITKGGMWDILSSYQLYYYNYGVNGQIRWGTGTYDYVAVDYQITNNQWIHTALILDEDDVIKLYVNGILRASNNLPIGEEMQSNTNSVWAGNSSSESIRMYNGLIDDVRIYNRALSAAEIAAIYNATK